MVGASSRAAVIMAALLASTSSAAGGRVLVVPAGAEDAAARAAVNALADVDVADPAATAELIEAASASGLTCGAVDAGCWARLGSLGGYHSVMLVTAEAVIVQGATTTNAPRLVAGFAGLAPAVRRAFGRAAALQLTVETPGAVVTVDGVEAAVVVDDLAVGQHLIEAHAPGYAPVSLSVDLAGGSVSQRALRLTPEVEGSSPLLMASLITMGVGGAAAVVGIAAGTYGKLDADGACNAEAHGSCDLARSGWWLAIGGGAVVVVGAVLFAVDVVVE